MNAFLHLIRNNSVYNYVVRKFDISAPERKYYFCQFDSYTGEKTGILEIHKLLGE